MEHVFVVAGFVLVSLIVLTEQKMWQSHGHGQSYKGYGHSHMGHSHRQTSRQQRCYPNAAQGDLCDTGKRCAWNRRECPNYVNCHLICTNNPYKQCYNRDEGDSCNGGTGENGDLDNWFECWNDSTGQLACIFVFSILEEYCG